MSIFKAYDIRGIYKKELTIKDAYLIGFYLPKLLKINKIKIAHDARLSQEILTKFLIKGLLDSNCEIIYLGISSTPNFYFSLFKGCNDGVMITASHNPKEYNGFKIMNKLNSFDSRNGLYDLEKIILKDDDKKIDEFNKIKKGLEKEKFEYFLKKNKIKLESTLNLYNDFIFNLYNKILSKKEQKILKKIKFNLDYSSGVSSLSGNIFFKKTNLNYNLLNNIVDGNFPNHSPDPVKAKDFLKNKKIKVDFSAVFDGDGDRIVFYDENNDFVLSDYTIAILIDYFSNNNNNKSFVCDLRISKQLEKIAKDKNLNLNLIRVGRAFYKDFMDKNNCKFGAELSGHLFFNEFSNLDNPDIAIIYMLKIIALDLIKNNKNKEKFKFSNLVSKYKTYFKMEELNIKIENPDLILKKLEKNYSKNIKMKIDGISFEFENYWFNIRKSNTEPIIRINFEGLNEKIVKFEFDNLIKFIKEK